MQTCEFWFTLLRKYLFIASYLFMRNIRRIKYFHNKENRNFHEICYFFWWLYRNRATSRMILILTCVVKVIVLSDLDLNVCCQNHHPKWLWLWPWRILSRSSLKRVDNTCQDQGHSRWWHLDSIRQDQGHTWDCSVSV